MSKPFSSSRRWAILCFAALLASVVACGFWGYSYDDAFITYTYARSWQEHGTLEFNPGERVFGTTAPGYALILGTFASLTPGVPVPAWGTILAVASLLGIVMLFVAAMARAVPEGAPAILAPAAFASLLFTWPLIIATFGAEAFPAALLVALGTWHLFGRERQVSAGVLLAAAAGLRPDAGLAACALGLAYWISRRRFPRRLFLAGSAGLVVDLSLVFSIFGRILPHTLAVKRSELALAGPASYSASEWGWLHRSLPAASGGALLALAALGVLWLARRRLLLRPPILALAAWLVTDEIAYRALGVPFAPWYGIDSLLALAALAAIGAAGAAAAAGAPLAALSRRSAHATRAQETAAFALCALLLAPILVPSTTWLVRQWGRPPDPRWTLYHEVSAWLHGHSRPGESIASLEVGFLGYDSRRPILDLMGLVSPGVLKSREHGDLAALVAARAPRFILDVPHLRVLGLGALLADPRISGWYAPVQTFPLAHGGPARILERRAGAPTEKGDL